jgi:hypothetical protein
MRIRKPSTRAWRKWFVLAALPFVLLLPLIHQMRQRTVTIHGPEVDIGVPPKVAERPYTLLADALHSYWLPEKFEVWSGAMGSTTQLVYNRREQTLVSSFYMLSSNFHTQWRNVSPETIEAVAQAEKTGNKIWWKKGDFHSTQIDAEAVLKKHRARVVQRSQNDIGDQ